MDRFIFGDVELKVSRDNMVNTMKIEGGENSTLTLEETANFDIEIEGLTTLDVKTINMNGTLKATMLKANPGILINVSFITGENGTAQTLEVGMAGRIDEVTVSDVETLTFGGFAVFVDTGNVANFTTAITGDGTGTLALEEAAAFDLGTTTLTGVTVISMNGIAKAT
jgi:hypothetical protein